MPKISLNSYNGRCRKLNSEMILKALRERKITPEEAKKQLDNLNKEIPTEKSDRISEENKIFGENAIAIIGMSGRYPKANDMEEYWNLLVNGKDGIREIPNSRWNMDEYYDPEKAKEGKIYCKWLGMIDDAECFDSLFFEIPPSEAETMEPLHRIFIEEGYKAFEDAGYTRQTLNNQKCGVYAGMITGEYEKLSQKYGNEKASITGSSNAIGAARLSYYLNLKGPAISVDTACSSSMVCVHLAAQALERGEIDMALVGGSSLYLSAGAYVAMCSAGMLSPEGKCKTFDNGADGFVPGEGAGALVLKRLADAERDHDHIYGVIIGSGMNQDGKTNGITAPNLGSQIELVRDIYEEYNISPESISYAEMHGTGTKLGDPIELEALGTAFLEKTKRKNFCAIGSVKSNLGHTSAASGMAGIQKVILCMQHKKMVPTLNVTTPNEHFDFDNSPFYINTQVKEWTKDHEPRRACVSSFGFSGTNAHVVIQEYKYPDNLDLENDYIGKKNPGIFVLSAKNEEQLVQYVQKMIQYIRQNNNFNLANYLYTLQVGREAMKERLAIVITGIEDLLTKLNHYLEGGADNKAIFRGVSLKKKLNYKNISSVSSKSRGEVRSLDGDIFAIAKEWVNGSEIDWLSIYGEKKPRRVSVPTIPLAKEPFWYKKEDTVQAKEKTSGSHINRLHPLVHQNTSDFLTQSFCSTFNGEEFFLNEHRVDDTKVLPGAAILEMARAASELSGGKSVKCVKDIIWLKPVSITDQENRVNIRLYPEQDQAAFKLSMLDSEKSETIYCEGKIEYWDGNINKFKNDIENIEKRCKARIAPENLYNAQEKGVLYGAHFQTITNVSYNDNEVLAKLRINGVLGNEAESELNDYILHPGLLDGALQTIFPLMTQEDSGDRTYLPFSLDKIEIYDSFQEDLYVYTTKVSGYDNNLIKRFNIDIMDKTGYVLSRILGFNVKAAADKTDNTLQNDNLFLLKSMWEEENAVVDNYDNKKVIVLDNNDRLYAELYTENTEAIYVRQGNAYSKKDEKQYEVDIYDKNSYLNLFHDIQQCNEVFPEWLIYNVTENSSIEKNADNEIYAILALTQALIELRIHSKIRLEYIYNIDSLSCLPEYDAVSAFFKTVQKENENLFFQCVGISASQTDAGRLKEIIIQELNAEEHCYEVHYDENKRYVKRIHQTDYEKKNITDTPFKDNGVYIITGGMGGVGFIFAQYICSHFKADVILTGRRDIDNEIELKLTKLNKMEAHAYYIKADVSDKNDVDTLIEKIKNKFNSINGVIHSAGITKDALIRNKKTEEFRQVLAPKIAGTRFLDEALAKEHLDFFVMCSSTSAVLGNFGQCDYCYANSYMDNYAEYRTALTKQKKRYGKTVSINWPYWAEGGMQISEDSQKRMKDAMGMYPLSSRDGISALEHSILSDENQLICVTGETDKLFSIFHVSESGFVTAEREKKQVVGSNSNARKINEDDIDVKYYAEEFLKSVFSEKMKIKIDKIDILESFETYGIDSIIIMTLTRRLEEDFGELPKTLFFEYQNIDELADYFVENYKDAILDMFYKEKATDVKLETAKLQPETAGQKEDIPKNRFWTETDIATNDSEQNMDDIAIIGISGKYPMADDLTEFWDNIKSGRDCISEIPQERWDHNRYYDSQKDVAGKAYAKWGGFVKDIDKFDPLFFNISPGEADFLDPQARLFLETVWHTLEDAGYTRASLANDKVGVFVGVMYSMYELYEGEVKGERVPVSSSFSAIANRVSYFMNFHGPSVAVDTMCSSSLTALHLGCESIKNGDSDLVFVGGVNLTLHPNKYLLLSQGHFASTDGRCKTFGKDGDGYVPGEGVGAILLKPLDKAIADHDNIYAVIKGSAINACGKTNGFTVPSPNAQAQLIQDALDKTNIDARTISYIEAHGTGTSLGDPIEIKGLTKAFKAYTEDLQFCSIGSVKSNIGHLESAAGIAAITKVVLQLKNHKLVPSIHSDELNPYINFSETPFYVQHKLEEWEKKAGDNAFPRRAGISAFGAGGSNAHVILEEYNPKRINVDEKDKQRLYVFSAKNIDRLNEYLRVFLDYISGKSGAYIDEYVQPAGNNTTDIKVIQEELCDILAQILEVSVDLLDCHIPIKEYGLDMIKFNLFKNLAADKYGLNKAVFDMDSFNTVKELADYILHDKFVPDSHFIHIQSDSLAYTLQLGREAMEERVAIKADSISDLAMKIHNYLSGGKLVDIYTGNVLDAKEDKESYKEIQKEAVRTKEMLLNENYSELAQLWVKGMDIDWKELYHGELPQKISLPGYCFAKEHCWVLSIDEMNKTSNKLCNEYLHPMLQKNISNLYGLKFRSDYSGNEFFIKDHVVNNIKMLPAVAYLEMICAAAKQIFDVADNSEIIIRNVIWIQPFSIEDVNKEIYVSFVPNDDAGVKFNIFSQDGEAPIVHCQGTVQVSEHAELEQLNIDEIKEECEKETTGQSYYSAFEEIGIHYGNSLRSIKKIYKDKNKAVVELCANECVKSDFDNFMLHPSMLDAAVQANIAFYDENGKGNITLPFALNEVRVLGKCSTEMFAYIRKVTKNSDDKLQKIDIDICNSKGYVCVKINQLAFREFDTQYNQKLIGSGQEENIEKLLFIPEWKECRVTNRTDRMDFDKKIIILCNQRKDVLEKLIPLAQSSEIFNLHSENENIAIRYNDCAVNLFDYIKKLFGSKVKGKVFIQLYVENQGENGLLAGLNGFLKTIQIENSNIICQLIESDSVKDAEEIYDLLKENTVADYDQHIRYVNNIRYVQKIQELTIPDKDQADIIWREKGVYLIAGGAGGLGLLVAEDIASKTKDAVLILAGRSELKDDVLERIENIRKMGAKIEYHRTDIINQNAVKDLVSDIVSRYHVLNGVIHCSGVIRDSLIVQKTSDTFRHVLEPKVLGIMNLDIATKDINMDWFIAFSSMASVIGNLGQSDYAAANGFMDCFVEYRNKLSDKKERFGQAVSLNWPLWKDGGMQIGADMEKVVAESSGFTPIEKKSGIQLLHKAVLSGCTQVLPVEGFSDKIRALFLENHSPKADENVTTEFNDTTGEKDNVVLEERLTVKIKEILAEETKLDISRIDARVPLENYGIDSVMIIRLTNALEKSYGSLPKTLFFDNQSIKELVQYLCKDFYAQTIKVLGMEESNTVEKAVSVQNLPTPKAEINRKFWVQKQEVIRNESIVKNGNGCAPLDIAIIGIAGQYPMAENVDTYWNNLIEGKDCVTEIPKERWDHSRYYDPDKSKQRKTYAKWGGFLNDVDCFDPMFFHISPVEAEIMDPQERLFLQCVYHAIEDAGYTKASLSLNEKDGLTSNVGVFVGVMYEEYQLYGAQAQMLGNNISLNGSAASIANRVSYVYGFHGPSIALDSMCSSSLAAIHLACNSIMNGECDTAIAGGVNLSIHPNKYLTLGRGKFVSSIGRCQTFGKNGDGYTPGEGVGTIILKSRERAIADGDHIYGIIRGSAVNHGGKTNGYTVPNPHAQTSVIKRAIAQSGINPRAISYIEAHGTGTSLGDPIEISALSRAFKEKTDEKQFCKIGSVKSNIGHCESAAGIAGITKVLMQMKYGKLVPSLHSEILNPNIDFENSPFVVSHEYEEWKRPVIEVNGMLKEYPRIAGISAFGAGGTNAHIIIEEYSGQEDVIAEDNTNYIIILSARKEEQLNKQVSQLLEWLKANQGENHSLMNIAYTLQVGREALDERVAFVVSSYAQLVDKLEDYIEGRGDYYKGKVKESNNILYRIDDDDMQEMIQKWFNEGKFLKIAELWVEGLSIEWDKLYIKKPKRISLPNYPFAKEHYWFSEDDLNLSNINVSGQRMHPLIHENISDFYEVKFVSTFTGTEAFFTDHIINGNKTMPAVGYMEMVYAAYCRAMNLKQENSKYVQLEDVVWMQPLIVKNEPVEVKLNLIPSNKDSAEFQIYSETTKEEISLYSKGIVGLCEHTGEPKLDIKTMEAEHILNRLESDYVYDYFSSIGIEYGPAQRGIQYILCGENSVLAKINLPEILAGTAKQYTLHPCILDSALQAAMGLSVKDEDKKADYNAKLPFMIQEMSIYDACTESMWAYIRPDDKSQTVHISLCDDSGTVRLEIKDIYYREIKDKNNEEKGADDNTEEQTLNETEEENVDVITDTQELYNETYQFLKEIFVRTLKIDESEIEEDVLFEKYGVDSILIMSLNEQLEKEFGKLPKTLLFEYQNMRTLSQYFINNHSEKIAELTNKGNVRTKTAAVRTEQNEEQKTIRLAKCNIAKRDSDDTEIAIIGLAGKYANAENLNEYWENIKNGVDCITEIPSSRWDYKKYFNPDKDHPGTTYTKWGGFLKDVDCFEPLFFNISPRDAVIMDPQERLFMECAYSAMEDAGYTRQTLGYCPGSEVRRNVGVYVGVMNEEYHLYAAQEQAKGYPKILSGNISQVANRFSYFCDFHGPSLTLDTMCSSSSVAIHLACQAIKNGECDMAIAGGVNVMVHPNKYLILASGKFASTDGRCASFGKGGDGYVPGEGVGAVLLKPKKKAIEDGDHIYGIIKGTAVNHGGKTNGYTVPNPLAQTEAIERAMKNAGVRADVVNYVEAHGTGTALGDPIEITALDKVYSQFDVEKQSCAIGSVKSNIGHCESASGIAALSKVLLQMKHKKIAPSLHSKELNPNIDFDNTPFYVPQKLEDWKRIKINENGKETEYPRTAGISSFGAGGTNAHIIVEEFMEDTPVHISGCQNQDAVIVMSAKSKEQLFKIASNILKRIKEGDIADIHSAAYTLQTGREEFEIRLAFTASSMTVMQNKLEELLSKDNYTGIYFGEVYKTLRNKDIVKRTDEAITDGNTEELCRLWTEGALIDWNRLYCNGKPKKVSLPTYPFANERYFIETTPNISIGAANRLNPVLHKNISSFYEQSFVSSFTGNEYYIANHLIGGRKVLPGAVTLEMARKAGEISLEHPVFIMKNIAWTNQIEVDENERDVYVSLYPHDDMIDYEVYLSDEASLEDDSEKVVCCEGSIEYDDISDYNISLDKLNLDEIINRLSHVMTGEACYSAMKDAGLINEAGFKVIDKIIYSDSEAVSYIHLSKEAKEEQKDYILHPSIINGAFQSAVSLMSKKSESENMVYLPFALSEIRIYAPMEENCIAYITESAANESTAFYKYDILITDMEGTLLAELNEFTLKAFKIDPAPEKKEEEEKTQYYTSKWVEQNPAGTTQLSITDNEVIVVFDNSGKEFENIKKVLNNAGVTAELINVKSGNAFSKIGKDVYQIDMTSFEQYKTLFEELRKEERRPQKMVVVKDYKDYQEDVKNLEHIYSLSYISKALMELHQERKLELIFMFIRKTERIQPEYNAVGGFAKSILMENPNFCYKVVEIEKWDEDENDILFPAETLLKEFGTGESEVQYRHHKRYIKSLAESNIGGSISQNGIRTGGTYLITGGLGGLGMVFARYIAEKKNIRLILTGRSPLSEEAAAKLDEIKCSGSDVLYLQADVSKKSDVLNIYTEIKRRYGKLDGIIHSAGVLRDSFLLKKSKEDMKCVFSAKVFGTRYLDEIFKEEQLDFFVLFSSIAGVFGNVGQSDYSYANSFMDYFAQQRNLDVSNGLRFGKTVSINWPLWKEGKMQVDQKTQEMMKAESGLVPIDMQDGITAFEASLQSTGDHLIVLKQVLKNS